MFMYQAARSCFLILLLAVPAYAESHPDVLFIAVDDLNDWNSLLDDDAPIKVPNLERLASRGTLFTRAYCASAACNPSRTATLTGLRPTTSGVYGNRSDWRKALPDRRTLMQQFREAGYDVRGAGKIFHHHLGGAFHDEDSFDHFQPMPQQRYPAKKLNRAADYGSRNTDWGKWPARSEDSIDHQTADYCVAALGSDRAKPLFLACGIFKPHSPWFAPAEFHTYADLAPPPRNAQDWDDLPAGADALMRSKRWFWNGMMRVERKQSGSFEQFVQSYAACVKFADHQIGRMLDALDATPRRNNTIVVLWSDHGFHLGEKDHIEKFALWEKSNHIPMIIVAPGVAAAGSRCDHPVDLTVLYPTLLELCGLPPDPGCDGVSVVPLLHDPKAAWTTPAVMTYGPGNHAVRSTRYRYIRYADGSEELYDHDYDPHEWDNLASDPAKASILRDHRQSLPSQNAAAVGDLKR